MQGRARVVASFPIHHRWTGHLQLLFIAFLFLLLPLITTILPESTSLSTLKISSRVTYSLDLVLPCSSCCLTAVYRQNQSPHLTLEAKTRIACDRPVFRLLRHLPANHLLPRQRQRLGYRTPLLAVAVTSFNNTASALASLFLSFVNFGTSQRH